MTDEEIFRANRADLVRYAAVLVGPVDAEDVVSAVVLRVLTRRSLGDLTEARPYLFRAVLNECRSLLSRRREPLTGADVVTVGVVESEFETLDVVLRLPPQQRAATYLVYWAGLSISEAACLMGVRPGTVKRYLHLGRRKMRGLFSVV